MFQVKIAAAALLLASTGAHAATLNFEGQNAGDKLTSFSVDGITGTIAATGGSGDAMVFNTASPTGGDGDLGAPFYDAFTGRAPARGTPSPGANSLNPGNVLIVSEDGDSNDPDDNGRGGKITFSFDAPVTFLGFNVFDDVTNFRVMANTGDSLMGIDLAYDNQFASFSGLNWKGVSSLTFDFGRQSGAIDDISFVAPVPVPASLPLALLAIGAFGVVARRRRG